MNPEQPEATRVHPDVKGLGRAACALVGMIGFAAGTLATFKTDNEIGTSALLLVGGISSLIALLGRVPRIKVGDNEIDPSVVAAYAAGADEVADAAAEAALEDGTPRDVAKAARQAANARSFAVGARFTLQRLPDGRKLPVVTQSARDDNGDQWLNIFTSNGKYIGRRSAGSESVLWDPEFKSDWNATQPAEHHIP